MDTSEDHTGLRESLEIRETTFLGVRKGIFEFDCTTFKKINVGSTLPQAEAAAAKIWSGVADRVAPDGRATGIRAPS